MTITLDTPVTDFPGVGPARAKKLEKLGILRAADLLTYYPRDYEDRRRIWSIRAAPLGEKVCVSALAAERPVLSYIRKGMELVKLRVVDNSGTLYLTFFNQSYLKNSFLPGEEYVFYGEIQEQGSRRSMVNPVFEREGDRDFTGRIVPVYPLTAGISNHLMVSLIRQAVEQCAGQGAESLPASLRAAHRLVPAERACRDIHFPEDFDALEQARRRLTFEELFYLSAGFQDRTLALDLSVDGLLHIGDRVQILNLCLYAEGIASFRTQGDIDVAAHAALFHLDVAHAQI